MRIAIVGAGPSGAIALDSFLDAGFSEIVVFERNKVVGGTWNLDEQLGNTDYDPVPGISTMGTAEPIQAPEESYAATFDNPVSTDQPKAKPEEYNEGALYPQVETNVLAELMAFSKRPFPKIHPPRTLERFGVEDAYRTHDVVREYVVDYFKGREHYVRLQSTVVKAWQPDGPGNSWRLVIRDNSFGIKEKWYTEDFDYLYAAIGHFSVPKIPNVQGLQEAVNKTPRGTVIHTKTFRNPNLYKGKRVLLVGAGFSNVDVIQLIQNAGAQLPLHLSMRSVLAVAISGFAQPWIETHPEITQVKIQKNSKLQIIFDDGNILEDVDNLILGTGYKYSFPFLREYVNQYDGGITSNDGRRTKNLFWSTWWKIDPSLAVAADITDSIFWRFIEHQARATAGLWRRNRKDWPSKELSDEWESARNSKGLKDFHTWWPYFPEIFTALAEWGGYDPGDTAIYLPLFNKGFHLKNKYWESLAEGWLKEHPEDQDRYNRTSAYLQEHIVKAVGL